MHYETGLVVGMHADEDGDANDVRFVPELLPLVRAEIAGAPMPGFSVALPIVYAGRTGMADNCDGMALQDAAGNQTKAAERLKLQRTYLARLLKQQRQKLEEKDHEAAGGIFQQPVRPAELQGDAR